MAYPPVESTICKLARLRNPADSHLERYTITDEVFKQWADDPQYALRIQKLEPGEGAERQQFKVCCYQYDPTEGQWRSSGDPLIVPAEHFIRTVREENVDLSDHQDYTGTVDPPGQFLDEVHMRGRPHSLSGTSLPLSLRMHGEAQSRPSTRTGHRQKSVWFQKHR